MEFLVCCQGPVDARAGLHEAKQSSGARSALLQDSSVRKVLPCCHKLVVIILSSGVKDFGVSKIDDVVFRVCKQHFFIAERSLGVHLLRQVNVCEFRPCLLVVLVQFHKLVEQFDSVVVHVHASVQCNKTLHTLHVGSIVVDQF